MTENNEHKVFTVDEIQYQEISDPIVFSKIPIVSAKMITYNHEPFIAKAIEGVLMQRTDFPFELVIGEDCSTDRTRKIVIEYQKKYPEIIRVITSEQNVGANVNSIRTGKACRGKYIALCEGDDFWSDPEKLTKQVEFLTKYSDCPGVCSDYNRLWQRTNKFEQRYIKKIGKECDYLQPNGINKYIPLWYCTCTLCFRVKYLNEYMDLRKSPELQNVISGDGILGFILLHAGPVGYIPEALATYRILEESASKSKHPEPIIRLIQGFLKIYEYFCDKYKYPEWVLKECYQLYCKSMLNVCYRVYDPSLALNIKKAVCHSNLKLNFRQKISIASTDNRAIFYFVNLCRKIYLVISNIVRSLHMCG